MKINNLIKVFHNSNGISDISSILEEHISSSDYDPYFDFNDLRVSVLKSLKDNNDLLLIENSYRILKHNAFDIESHALISLAARKLLRTNIDILHNNIATAILNNIIKNSDGLGYRTAYKIYYPGDEMAVFNYFKKYPSDRINHEKEGSCFDIYSFPDNSKIFFDISIPFVHISKKFAHLDEK